MSKKNRRRCDRHAPQLDSKLYFSLPTARLLKDALGFFERYLLGNSDTLPNIPLAKEVTSTLHRKIEDMLQREEWEKETPLEYNEACILNAACHMYLVELKYSHQYALIPACIALCRQFGQLVAHVAKDSQGVRPASGRKSNHDRSH